MEHLTLWLHRQGLLNRECESLRGYIVDRPTDRKGTFCNRCYTTSARGKLVHVGEKYLEKCPRCGSKELYFQAIINDRDMKGFERGQ